MGSLRGGGVCVAVSKPVCDSEHSHTVGQIDRYAGFWHRQCWRDWILSANQAHNARKVTKGGRAELDNSIDRVCVCVCVCVCVFQLSEALQVQTPAVPPGPCQPPRVVGRPKARELQLRWSESSPLLALHMSLSVCPSECSKGDFGERVC